MPLKRNTSLPGFFSKAEQVVREKLPNQTSAVQARRST